jgi:hypothetical protein
MEVQDPIVAMIQMMEKENCRTTFQLHSDHIAHLKNRMVERGLTPAEAVIAIMNVDDVNGDVIANVLMPNFDWQAIRAGGGIPFAKGLFKREGFQDLLGTFDVPAAEKLKNMTDAAVVVIDHTVAEVFPA